MKYKKNYTLKVKHLQSQISYTMYFIAILITLGCSKEENFGHPKFNQMKFSNCHNELNLDSLEILNSLIGVWELEFSDCAFLKGISADELPSNKLEFIDKNHMKVFYADTLFKSYKWNTMKTNNNLFYINTEPKSIHLAGQIMLCKEYVVFALQYGDICDQYYHRIK